MPTSSNSAVQCRSDSRPKPSSDARWSIEAYFSGPSHGFTLIELLVVMIIIAILMAVAIPIYTGQKAKARASNAKVAVDSAAKAITSCSAGLQSGSYYETKDDGSLVRCDTTDAIAKEDPGLKTALVDDVNWSNLADAERDVNAGKVYVWPGSEFTDPQIAANPHYIVGTRVSGIEPPVYIALVYSESRMVNAILGGHRFIDDVAPSGIESGKVYRLCFTDLNANLADQGESVKRICPTGRW